MEKNLKAKNHCLKKNFAKKQWEAVFPKTKPKRSDQQKLAPIFSLQFQLILEARAQGRFLRPKNKKHLLWDKFLCAPQLNGGQNIM